MEKVESVSRTFLKHTPLSSCTPDAACMVPADVLFTAHHDAKNTEHQCFEGHPGGKV